MRSSRMPPTNLRRELFPSEPGPDRGRYGARDRSGKPEPVTTGQVIKGNAAAEGLYAALGFYGLAHYAVAPVVAHSLAMNLTIGCEVAAAALLAVCVALEARRQLRVSEGSGI